MRNSRIYAGLLLTSVIFLLIISGCSKVEETDETTPENNVMEEIEEEPVSTTPTEPAPAIPVCGDNNLDDGEECDGDIPSDVTCESKGYDDGAVSCKDDCTINLSACTKDESCTDTDGGIDYDVKGTVTLTTGSITKYVDYCRQADGPFEGYVFEYYCANGTVKSDNYRCPIRCNNGACS